MVKCTINGKSVEVEKGSSIIQAFKQLDEDIAHYCWHPGLSVAGVCRLCMVEVEGNPRLQIACNTPVGEGMVITNQSEKVKDAVKWGLDFHLINHPLDCPICDQAGECELQNQYMHFGQYDSEMSASKVKKRKVVDLGERVVLDSERCILCSRCVRFTEEVSKTNELGIFNRGDRSEIGTFEDKPLNNKYSVNTVDICPVGALTSKDFRFRQRVWFLKDKPSVCTGCSTGCSINVYYNKEGLWRVRPKHSEVNGYWMCDEGREIYKATNSTLTEFVGERGHKKTVKNPNRITLLGIDKVKEIYSNKSQYAKAALVLTGQYTNEEYDGILPFWKKTFGAEIYHWQNNPEQWGEFDGLLLRGDKNPNTQGLQKAFEKHGIQAKNDCSDFSGFDLVVVAGPENQWNFSDIGEKARAFAKAKKVLWLSSCIVKEAEGVDGHFDFVPMKTFAEKSGTFTNHAGVEQPFEKVDIFVEGALSLSDMAQLLDGKDVSLDPINEVVSVANEFSYHRGDL